MQWLYDELGVNELPTTTFLQPRGRVSEVEAPAFALSYLHATTIICLHTIAVFVVNVDLN